MTGVIEMEGMEFYAFHGCYAAERLVGNKFRVDAEIRYDCTLAARNDEIADALSYQTAYEVIAAEMRTVSHLLEHVAQRMIDALYARFPQAVYVKIKVSKLNPPLGGKIQSTGVTLEK
ncbi:MAG: dihydroneopterin aldolase [Culturomica sp.]|jgi:dihydroneopterin aldolase|nr:dihydroneopterin aldolase [Culturomica sp.]